jgi:hypothetical protein
LQWMKQSTAASLIVGPVLDSTGAEYASAVIGDLSLSKNGATLTALASAATLTYIANGYYTLALTTGNTDTLGRADISCNKSTYQMPPRELMILPATVYDALTTNATTAAGGLGDIQRMAGTALTGRDIGASVLLSSGTGTGQVSLSSGAVLLQPTQTGVTIPTVTTVTNQLTAAQIATGVWQDTTAGDFTVVSSIGKSLYTSGNAPGATSGLALVGSNVGTATSVSGSVGSVTGAVGSVTAGVTVTTNNDKTGYSLTATTGLGNQTANITGNLSGSVGSVTGAVGSVTARVTANADQFGGATVTATTGVTFPASCTVATTTGAVGSVTGAVGSVTGNVGGSVGSVTARVTANTDQLAGQTVTAAAGVTFPSSVGTSTYAGADTSGTTTLLDRLTSTRAGLLDNLDAAVSTRLASASYTAPPTAASNASAVRTELTTELGRIDAAVTTRASQTSLDTLDDYVDTEVAAIKAKTDLIPASPAAVGSAMTLTSGERASIADTTLRRTMANVEASSDGDTPGLSSLYGSVQQMQESAASGSTLTVKKTDGTTTLGTKTLASDAAADPITGIS